MRQVWRYGTAWQTVAGPVSVSALSSWSGVLAPDPGAIGTEAPFGGFPSSELVFLPLPPWWSWTARDGGWGGRPLPGPVLSHQSAGAPSRRAVSPSGVESFRELVGSTGHLLPRPHVHPGLAFALYSCKPGCSFQCPPEGRSVFEAPQHRPPWRALWRSATAGGVRFCPQGKFLTRTAGCG